MKMKYTSDDVLKTAKRLNNTKRSYLLVDPLQAKHIPVSPKKALLMMRTLGKMLSEKYPNTRLIIGFAETATAIGAAVSESFSDECVYIHTTREEFLGAFVYFSEEHSHAVEQKLFSEKLGEYISAAEQIIFVDDEISTGKTLINIAESLKKDFPAAENKEFIAASIINRVSEENEERLLNAGIKSECLVKLSCVDYDALIKDIRVNEAERITAGNADYSLMKLPQTLPNARKGVKAGEHKRRIREIMRGAADMLKLQKDEDILVLGTEECMYPALILGEILEENGARVLCHSTTRSPIGINNAEDYPIKNGYRLRSFYDSSRETFIYNISKHSAAIIVSDSHADDRSAGIEDLTSVLKRNGIEKIYFFGVD